MKIFSKKLKSANYPSFIVSNCDAGQINLFKSQPINKDYLSSFRWCNVTKLSTIQGSVNLTKEKTQGQGIVVLRVNARHWLGSLRVRISPPTLFSVDDLDVRRRRLGNENKHARERPLTPSPISDDYSNHTLPNIRKVRCFMHRTRSLTSDVIVVAPPFYNKWWSRKTQARCIANTTNFMLSMYTYEVFA